MPFIHALLLILALLFTATASAGVNPDKCFANGWTKAQLVALPKADTVPDNLQSFARQLRHCLASHDPQLRDNTAFTLLSAWMRNNLLTKTTREMLLTQLTDDLNSQDAQEHGVYLPFALLVVSEVLRTDRNSPFLDHQQRDNTITTVRTYLASLEDYRGFSDDAGWRHNVAHGADVYLQLALNDRVTPPQISAMAHSLAQQVNPKRLHFYHYNEPQRLARAVAYLMLRDAQPVTFWQDWLEKVASPSPFAQWGAVFNSQEGLAKRHNTRAFLLELHQLISSSQNARLMMLSELTASALQESA